MLRLEGITKIFGGVTALENVSCSIKEGDITGIIGPNGAGKTTLFNIVTGIYSATAGKVFFNNTEITGYVPERLAKLGMVRTFQNLELFGRMSVLENVMIGCHSRSRSGILACLLKLPGHLREEKTIRQESMRWLEYTGIADSAGQEAGSLPFGKCRLLEIARALALNPKIILLDEPAAGLNSRETDELADLLRKIRDSGISIILVEHDMELVMNICDSIMVLNLGRKLAEGTPRQIQENKEVVEAYLGEE
jgi:branched-chain amino acid transport system ATP-binding protein